jgi:hypothetical protein
MRGTGFMDYDLPGALNAWHADVVIIIEPPGWMRMRGPAESVLMYRPVPHAAPVPSNWRLILGNSGHAQGHVGVAYQTESVVAVRGVSVPGTGQNNHLMFVTATVRAEARVIAACHAPFAQNSGEAQQYIRNGMALIRAGVPGQAIVQDWPDVWMGDFNTYGPTAPHGASPQYVIAMARGTSGFGPNASNLHWPLDKIMRRATLAGTTCGRIIPLSIPALPGDIHQPTWNTNAMVPSDHVPIYIDTAAPAAAFAFPGAAPPPPAPPAAPGGADRKRFRFTDPEPKRRRTGGPGQAGGGDDA